MRIPLLRCFVAVVTGGGLVVALAWSLVAHAQVPDSRAHSAAADSGPRGGSEIARLRNHVERLERRVEQLERHLAAISEAKRIVPLEAQMAVPEAAPPRFLPFAAPQKLPSEPNRDQIPPHLPDGSRRGEINGTPFYFIPLSGRNDRGK